MLSRPAMRPAGSWLSFLRLYKIPPQRLSRLGKSASPACTYKYGLCISKQICCGEHFADARSTAVVHTNVSRKAKKKYDGDTFAIYGCVYWLNFLSPRVKNEYIKNSAHTALVGPRRADDVHHAAGCMQGSWSVVRWVHAGLNFACGCRKTGSIYKFIKERKVHVNFDDMQ